MVAAATDRPAYNIHSEGQLWLLCLSGCLVSLGNEQHVPYYHMLVDVVLTIRAGKR